MKKWKVFEVSYGHQRDSRQLLEDKLNEIERDGWNTFDVSTLETYYYAVTIVAWKEKSIQTPEKEASDGKED
tara:strand:- start:263 stop:478 length:216 start_codon:yes stop_codon:yes gene_type:complete